MRFIYSFRCSRAHIHTHRHTRAGLSAGCRVCRQLHNSPARRFTFSLFLRPSPSAQSSPTAASAASSPTTFPPAASFPSTSVAFLRPYFPRGSLRATLFSLPHHSLPHSPLHSLSFSIKPKFHPLPLYFRLIAARSVHKREVFRLR